MPGYTDAAASVAALLDRTERSRAFPPEVARELLAGYIDKLAAWAVGEHGAGALVCCLGELLPSAQ